MQYNTGFYGLHLNFCCSKGAAFISSDYLRMVKVAQRPGSQDSIPDSCGVQISQKDARQKASIAVGDTENRAGWVRKHLR